MPSFSFLFGPQIPYAILLFVVTLLGMDTQFPEIDYTLTKLALHT